MYSILFAKNALETIYTFMKRILVSLPKEAIYSQDLECFRLFRIAMMPTLASTDQDTIYIIVEEDIVPEFSVFNCLSNPVNQEIAVSLFPTGLYDSLDVRLFDDMNMLLGAVTVEEGNEIVRFPVTVQGNYRVEVQGRFDDGGLNCTPGIRTINTNDPFSAPTLDTIQILQDSSIQLNFGLSNNIIHQLGVLNSQNPSTDTIFNVEGPLDALNILNQNTFNEVLCFNISTLDGCVNNIQLLESGTACTVILSTTVLSAQSSIQLDWQTQNSLVSQYLIFRNGIQIQTISDPNQTTYIDTDVICGDVLEYQIVGIFNNNTVSISNTSMAIADSNQPPPTITSITATVINGNQVSLSWETPTNIPTDIFTISRSQSSGSFEVIGNSTTTNFLDETAAADQLVNAYQILYSDICGNTSAPSVIARPILLQGNVVPDPGARNELEWTFYEGWETGVASYDIVRSQTVLANVPNDINSFDDISNSTTSTPTFSYRIIAASNDTPTLFAESNEIILTTPPSIFIPNTFTPNQDGLNDLFSVRGRFITDVTVDIFARDGERVASFSGLENGWDGTINGRTAPPGYYSYRALIEEFDGNTRVMRGTVLILEVNR